MTDLRKAAEMALTSLMAWKEQSPQYWDYDDIGAVEALRQALAQPEPFKPDWVSYRQGVADGAAQPEQELVAWITRRTGDGGVVISGYETCEPTDYDAIPVYTAPVSKQESVVIEPTKDQIKQITDGLEHCFSNESRREFLRVWVRDWTLHKLSKNIAQPEQEPVAWWNPTTDNASTDPYYRKSKECIPLYSAQPSKPWVSLTDDDRIEIFNSMDGGIYGFLKTWGWLNFSKELEAKLKEKNT